MRARIPGRGAETHDRSAVARRRGGDRKIQKHQLAFILLAAVAWLHCAAEDPPRTGGFDGARAFADLRDQVAIGPRPAGSEGAERTRALISERLRQAGWPVEAHRFQAEPPDGSTIEMVNLIARQPGESEDTLVLAAHYDTKPIPGVRFLGANDGASGVAILLELARVWGRRRGPFTVELVFFDGEEARGSNITARDGLYGSRALAERMQADGALERVRAFVLVDMVGDRDLNIAIDQNSSAELRALFGEVAGDLVDPSHRLRLIDDHMPFRERGVGKVLALIDFQYGSRRSPGPLWHTAGDGLDGVSAESLNRVGDALVQLVSRLEQSLERPRESSEAGVK